MNIKTILLSSIALSSVTAAALAGPGMWAQLDANRDGKLTQDEMQTAAAEKIKAADTDGDNAASREELKAYFQAKHAQKKADRFAKKDTNGDGVLSNDEVPRMPQELFTKLDADGDGALSQDELSAKFGKHGKSKAHKDPAARAARVGKRFAKLDKNADGGIARDEVPKMPEPRFSQMDSDGNGVISSDEFAAARSAKGHGKRWGKGKLPNVDTNGDGKIDVAEAQAAAAQRFAKMDKNGDGVITEDERTHPGRKGKARGFKGKRSGQGSPTE